MAGLPLEFDACAASLHGFKYAARTLGWLTKHGAALVESLRQEIRKVKKRITRYEGGILASRHGLALRRHRQELQAARQTYGAGHFRR